MFRGADGDANPFGQLVAAHGAHDDALLLHGFEHTLAFFHTDQQEVGGGADKFDARLAQGAFIKGQPGKIVRPRLANVLVIIQRRQGGGLGGQIEVKWLTDFLQCGGQFRAGDAVAHAEAGQTVDFRECAH